MQVDMWDQATVAIGGFSRMDDATESLRKAREDLKNLQEGVGGDSGDSQQDSAVVNWTQRSRHGEGTPEVSPRQISKTERKKVSIVPKRPLEEQSKPSFASPSPWNTLPREVHMALVHTQMNEGDTTDRSVDGHDQPKIYNIQDHTLQVLMHPSILEYTCRPREQGLDGQQ